MRELAGRALDRKVTLMLENEKGIYGDTAARVADLLEAVDSPALAHAFDPANYVEVGQDIDEAWRPAAWPRVKHFHVKDYDTRTHRNVPAGEGDGQIPSLLERAVQVGLRRFRRARAPPRGRRGLVRLHRPRAVRRRRDGPEEHPRPRARSRYA